jgi:hypothetical protein
LKREHGDVVFLPELLRGKRDCFGGLVADGGGMVEAKEFATCTSCFDDTVCQERELHAGWHPDRRFRIG